MEIVGTASVGSAQKDQLDERINEGMRNIFKAFLGIAQNGAARRLFPSRISASKDQWPSKLVKVWDKWLMQPRSPAQELTIPALEVLR